MPEIEPTLAEMDAAEAAADAKALKAERTRKSRNPDVTMGDLAVDIARRNDLRAIPAKWGDPPADMLAKLPKGGDKDKNNWATCKQCGGWHAKNAVHLDYMGHADVTLALIDTDPLWEWEPVAWEAGAPAIVVNAGEASMWIRMTVLGKTLPAVGTCPANKGDMFKELVGDALRNGALRFGIATKLWSKTDGAASSSPEEAPVAPPAPRTAPAAARSGGPTAPPAASSPAPPPAPSTPPNEAAEQVSLDGTTLARLHALRHSPLNKSDGQWTAVLATIARQVGQLPADLPAMVQNEAIWTAAATKYELA